MTATTTRARGRYALSLRVLLIVVLVLGGGVGWTVNRANRRRAAVDAVKKAKGALSFDYQYAGETARPGGTPWPPGWLLPLLPVEFPGLERLGEIKSLRWLNLSGTRITDAGLEHLSRLAALEQLFIDGSELTDGGLKHLCGLRSLKALFVGGDRIGVDGVGELRAALPPSTVVRMGKGRGVRAAADLRGGP
jgi:hypothetical protein